MNHVAHTDNDTNYMSPNYRGSYGSESIYCVIKGCYNIVCEGELCDQCQHEKEIDDFYDRKFEEKYDR